MNTGIKPLGWLLLAAFATLCVAAFSGCVHTVIELPNQGGKFSRTSVLSNQTIGDIDVNLEGANKGVRIKAYGKQGTDVAAKALETAAAALRVKP